MRALAVAVSIGSLAFVGPSLGSVTVGQTANGSRLPRGYKTWGLATQLEVAVYDSFDPGGQVIGQIRRGSRVPVRSAGVRRPCVFEGQRGKWLETPGGYLCTGDGITVGGRPSRLKPRQRTIDLRYAMPFDYVKVTAAGVPRYTRPVASPKYEVERQTKAFFLAKDRSFRLNGEGWLRTVYGEHVKLSKTRPVAPSKLRGVKLSAHTKLPIAFIVGPEEGVTRRCQEDTQLVYCGRAEKHSRFKPRGRTMIGTQEYVRGRGDRLYPAQYVRVAEVITRPDGVPSDARWVHVDLDEQTFVAYEGDVPRYASLVSSGIEGRDTPTGLYRTQRKYVTKTMRGPDEKAGRYRVEEIPWVLYYHGAYAIHGAYWHNQFGEVRSHGCTNIAPTDAQWLFRFDKAGVRDGWHANLNANQGLYLYFSRFEEEDPFDES